MGTYSAIRPSLTLRAVRAVFAAILLSALFVVAGSGEADAATPSGTIAIKRLGATNYGEVAGFVANAGGTAQYYLRVRNTGSAVDQFRVKVTTEDHFEVTRTLRKGQTDVTAAASAPQGYLTPAIAPGRSLLLTFVVRVADDANHDGTNFVHTGFDLWSSADDVNLDRAAGQTILESTSGITAWDGFVRAGHGRLAGGSTPDIVFGDALNPGQGTTFTVRLQNDSSAPSTIGLKTSAVSFVCAADWPITVRDGFKDVTTAAKAGTYVTPTLNPGSHRDVTVRITNAGGGPDCSSQVHMAVLKGQGGPVNVVENGAVGPAQP
jgi:hypothetical protein